MKRRTSGGSPDNYKPLTRFTRSAELTHTLATNRKQQVVSAHGYI